MTSDDEPRVDPNSPNGHILVTRNFLAEKLGKLTPALQANLTGTSPCGRRFWFRDLPEVRAELGMEVKS